MWTFRDATPADWPQIADLLTSVKLPLDGAEEHLGAFLLAFGGTTLLGTACLEYYGTTALLRSVAIAETARGTGLGQALVRRMIERTRSDGIHSIVLLTTSAAEFFPRFGFRPIARAEVPAAAQQSIEFRSVCPAAPRRCCYHCLLLLAKAQSSPDEALADTKGWLDHACSRGYT